MHNNKNNQFKGQPRNQQMQGMPMPGGMRPMGMGGMPQQQFMGQQMFMPQMHPQMAMGGQGMMPYAGGFPMMAGQPGGQMMPFNNQAMMQNQNNQQQANAYAQKQAQIGPQTSLKELCEITNLPIIFKTPEKDYCEKCFQEKIREVQQQNKKGAQNQENVSPIADDDLLSRLKEPAKPFQAPNLEEEQDQSEEKTDSETVLELHGKIEALCQSLSQKIEKKNEGLYLNHQHFAIYESTLNEKYQPVFEQMKQIIQDKRHEYQHYLSSQLLKNDETVKRERAVLDKMQASLQSIQDEFKKEFDSQSQTIKEQEQLDKQAAEEKKQKEEKTEQEADKESDEEVKESKKSQEESKKELVVDSYRISAMAQMLDDFENVLGKNFCQFANYEDFSFAKSRTTESLQEQFYQFFDTHFQGDFRVKNWFQSNVLPRIYYPQQASKFIHCFKILNNVSQCVLIQNPFTLPDRCRCIITPEGNCYLFGGYLQMIKSFLKNTFILDEHRSSLVALQTMEQGRADHGLHMNGDKIYVLGGMSYKKNEDGTDHQQQVVSLNSCEIYSVADDKWEAMEPFQHARQQFSVCHFNEKFIFIFGGKQLKEGKSVANGPQPFDFVKEVEVYEIEKKTWKTLNYISEPQRLMVIAPGTAQIAGSQILIFGGLIPSENEEADPATDFADSGTKLTLTNQSLILDVTVGSIKYGPELNTPSYFISGSYKLLHQNQIYAFGLGMPAQHLAIAHSMAAGATPGESDPNEKTRQYVIGANGHKKLLHCYKVGEAKWAETNESIFSGQRRESDLED